MKSFHQDWCSNVRNDLLAGMVVALALIPEAIAFSIIAGVDPKVGLYASFSMAVVIAIAGGRPGMISAATGAMALLMVTLVKDHGLQYLLAATLLTGVMQIICGWLKLGSLMRFVSRSVITGFVNALAILIFMAQMPELIGMGNTVYIMVAAGLAIIYLFPYITKSIPSPLVAIVVLSIIAIVFGFDIRTVSDMGQLPDSLPVFLLPDVPLNWQTFTIIFPVAATLTVVGLLESMMTASIVDDFTDTNSNKNRECVGQGVANIATGFIGGMAGCGMIGQSVINVKSGGRGRLSTFAAGVFLLIMIVFAADWVGRIPMAALVAVMIMVSIGTFNWASIRNLREHPKGSSVVMLATVIVVVATHDLAKGVLVGVLLSGFFFAHKVGLVLRVKTRFEEEGRQRYYRIIGQVFFASAERFVSSFDFKEVIEKVRIDVSRAHFWDITAISALDKVVVKFRREGTEVEVVGLNKASATMVDRFALDAAEQLPDKPPEQIRTDNKVLACVDQSHFSDYVSDYAVWAAQRINAPLEFLHILERHPEIATNTKDHSGAIGVGSKDALLTELAHEDEVTNKKAKEQGRMFLNQLRDDAIKKGIQYPDVRQRYGVLEEALAEQENINLFVLGRRGESAEVSHKNLGKNVESVVRALHHPVLAVTEKFKEPRRIMIAFDGSTIAKKSIVVVANSRLFKGLPIHILMSGKETIEAKKQLTLAEIKLKDAGFEVSSDFLKGSVEDNIEKAVQTREIDMLVMGAYSHSSLRGLLFGSKTSDLLRAVKIPTLLVR